MSEVITDPPERDVNDALEAVLGVGANPPAEEPPATDAPAAPDATPDPAAPAQDAPKYVVAGRGYKDEDELVKALENANQLISSRADPEPEPEEDPDPWEHIPGVPQDQKTELYKWATDDPIAAGKWAWENQANLPQEIHSQVVAYAMKEDPVGWERYREDRYRAMTEQTATAATARFAEAEQNQIAETAESTLRGELGAAYDQYEPRINERITAGQYVKPAPGTPVKEAVLTVFRNIYRDLWLEDNYDAIAAMAAAAADGQPIAPAAPAAPAPNPAAAVTALPGGAAPAAPQTDETIAAINRALGLG